MICPGITEIKKNTTVIIKFCSYPDINKSDIIPTIPTNPSTTTILYLMIIPVTMVSTPIREDIKANNGKV